MIHRPATSRGFSLVELTIVMAVVAIIAAIAVPRYSAAVARYRADAAIRRVAADIARTRQLARMSSATRAIEFNLDKNAYSIAAETSLKSRQAGSLVSLAEEPYRATLVQAEFGGSNILQFNGFGIPSSPGAITLTVGTLKRTLTVDGTTGVMTIGA